MKDEPSKADEDLKKKVEKDLLESGFPFEARIARAFANLEMDEEYKEFYVEERGTRPMETLGCLNRGVPVRCGGSYLDPIEKKSRELDVQSIMPLSIHGTDLWIHFLVQCKDTNKVWTFGHYGMEAVPTIKDKFVNLGIDFNSREKRLELQLFHPDPVLAIDPHFLCGIGRVLNTYGKKDEKNKDEIFEACSTAVNAARYYQGSAETLGKQDADFKEKRLIVYIPMVATGNKLFFADLSNDNPEVQETDVVFCVHQGMTDQGNHTHYILPIITEESLPRIVNAFVKSSVRFLERFFTS